MQVLFSLEQNDLFKFVEVQIYKLKSYVERSEVWIQTIRSKNINLGNHECNKINMILENLKNSLYHGCIIDSGMCLIPEDNVSLKIDKEK